MKLQKIIDKFNQPDTHLVISQWPDAKLKQSYHGVAAYTRETLITLCKRHNQKFVVLAETNHNNQPQLLLNGRILVLRVFDHKHPSLYPAILTWLTRFSKIRQVTVHSEFGAYSGIRHFILLIPFLIAIKLTGRKIIHFSHNTIESIDYIANQFGITNSFYINLLNICVRVYNRLIGIITDKVVVLDAYGKEILDKFITQDKLFYNPLWFKTQITSWTKTAAKKALGINPNTKVLMAFGFISWYKGSDQLAKMFSKTVGNNPKYQLLFAGGKAPSLEKSVSYKKYHSDFTFAVNKYSNITYTGFILEKDLGKYFAAADLIVLPYRGLMGGSATLGYTIGYDKPFMLSRAMNTIWANADFGQALKENGMTQNQVMFLPTVVGMKNILTIINDNKKLNQLKSFSKSLKTRRGIETITDQLYNELYSNKNTYANSLPHLSISGASA